MKKNRDVRVRYTHPAIPPIGIKVNEVYKIGDLLDIYEVNDLIKVMFTPIDTTWKKLDDKSIKRNKIEETEVKDLKVIDEKRD